MGDLKRTKGASYQIISSSITCKKFIVLSCAYQFISQVRNCILTKGSMQKKQALVCLHKVGNLIIMANEARYANSYDQEDGFVAVKIIMNWHSRMARRPSPSYAE